MKDGLHVEVLIAGGDDVVGVCVRLVLNVAIVSDLVLVLKICLYLGVEHERDDGKI